MRKTTRKEEQYPEVVENHSRALRGTGFEKCAPCPGCSGKVEADGRMRCSRCAGVPVSVTAEQAGKCDGTKPPPFNKNQKPRPIFRRAGHRA